MGANTVWVALASPNSPAGGIPFIDSQNETDIDVLNFFYDSVAQMMQVRNGIAFGCTFAAVAGDQTINTISGVVLFAPGTQELVVTNSLVNNSSLIIPFIGWDDPTAKSVVINGHILGQFRLKLNVACTNQLKVGFLVLPIFQPVAR